ncbi:hypothetical protein AX15_005282 [Amanita polypyramis BW_CC]|nr:hypothetical protein AX15_005282 [Amanita polypyramis BW_CC]
MENVQQAPEVALLVAGLTPQRLIIVSLLVAGLLLALIVLFNNRKSSKQGDALLVVGLSDAGKTAIWSTLAFGQTPLTHTSLQTNSAVYSLPQPKKMLRIIDVPGHPRLRDQFQSYMPSAKAIAFVVDASTISRNGTAVAEHLHHILHAITSLPPSQSPPLLVLAHKVDLLKGHLGTSDSAANLGISRVKTILERELEKRRAAQSTSVGIEGLGEEGERTELGGLECSGSTGNAFKFDDWEGGEVTFRATWLQVQSSSSEKGGDEKADGLGHLMGWLDEHCSNN